MPSTTKDSYQSLLLDVPHNQQVLDFSWSEEPNFMKSQSVPLNMMSSESGLFSLEIE